MGVKAKVKAEKSDQDIKREIQQEIEDLTLPEDWWVRFNGFGGSDPKFETKVYSIGSGEDFRFEIRIPMDPEAFPPEKVEEEYRCRSALSLQEAVDDLEEALDGAD
jgi:hypothetical protein